MCAACRTVRIVQTVGGGALGSNTVKWDKQATATQTKPNVAKERKPHTDFALLVWQEFSSSAWIQTQKKKKNPEGEGGGGASYWDAAAERRLKCLIIIFPRDIVLSSVCVLLWLSLCKNEPTFIFFFFFATEASQPIQSNKTVICLAQVLSVFISCLLSLVLNVVWGVQKSHCGCYVFATLTWNQWSTANQKLAFDLAMSNVCDLVTWVLY